MVTYNTQVRFISEKRYFLVFWILFTLVFSSLAYLAREKVGIGVSSPYIYYTQYGIYLPLAIGLSSIVISYILLIFTHILWLRQALIKVWIYLLVYGFWLTLAIQLAYIEPRYTDVAIVLIDAYAFPLLIASSVTIVSVILLSFFKR